MFILLVPIMIFMWLVSGLFIWWLIPPLDYVRYKNRHIIIYKDLL